MKKTWKILYATIAVFLFTALVSSCSSVNSESPLGLVDASGNHPDGWISGHSSFAAPDGSLCMECHGEDLAGGISGVSCSTDSYGGVVCHGNGPAFHPPDWLDSSLTGNSWHGDAYDNGYLVNGLDCVDCHAPLGVAWPDGGNCVVCHFTRSGGRSPGGWTHGSENHGGYAGSPEEPVCVACHEINIGFGNQESCHNCHSVSHDKPYLDHYLAVPTATDFTDQCSACHSVTGPAAGGAPACTSCHTQGSPYTRTNCTSCHGRPPGTGEHGEHVGEASCDDCHLGAGTGSGLDHGYDGYAVGVDVAFPASVDINYNGSSCTGDCHGVEHDENW